MNNAGNTSQKRRITMVVSNDLLTDQRVQRSCDTLFEAGYDVTLVGRAWPDNTPLKKKYKTCKMRLLFKRRVLFYAELNVRLFLKLLFSRADLFYANDTDTLLSVAFAARLRRKPFVFDGHELFPDVPELVDKPMVRKVWQCVERSFIPKSAVRITVNQGVAYEYERRYGVSFGVVRNLSSILDSEVSAHPTSPEFDFHDSKVLLYQGAVNKGRCVKELIDAMEYLPDCRLVVVGSGDIKDEMQRYAGGKSYAGRISFTGRMMPDDLRRLTSQAALGFCIMQNMGLNYYLSLPNRISDYAVAGIPVLASDFPEIRRVVEEYGLGTLVAEDTVANPQGLASVVRATLAQWQSMAGEERSARFARAKAELTWESEKKLLVGYVDKAIGCRH